MDVKNINLKKLYDTLYKFKFNLLMIKPSTYFMLKTYVQEKIDIQVSSLRKQANFHYEAILNDELIDYIANKENSRISYNFYNVLIDEKYQDKLLKKMPRNHPLKISNKILLITFCSTLAISLIVFFMLINEFSFLTLMYSVATIIISAIIALIEKKVYLLLTYGIIVKHNWN